MMWSVSLRAVGKSSVNGMFRFLSWVERRCVVVNPGVLRGKEDVEEVTHLVQVILALFGIVNCWLIPIMPKVSRSNKSITACSMHKSQLSLISSKS